MKSHLIFHLILGFATFIASAQDNPKSTYKEADDSEFGRLVEFIITESEENRRVRPVVLFSKPGFRGKSFDLDEDWTANRRRNHWDDRIASIEVPRGWEVRVYEHRNFRGRVLVIDDDWSVRDNPWWRNRISSVSLINLNHRRHPPHTRRHRNRDGRRGHRRESGITVYEHKRFSGSSLTIKGDWSMWESDAFWNDEISSIKVPKGYVITLYKHAGFKGQSLKLRGPCSVKLDKKWNNEVSSIRIRKR
ncbi:MAG: beta/gamma crystallin-related protein [Saprospiraceae bacterium]